MTAIISGDFFNYPILQVLENGYSMNPVGSVARLYKGPLPASLGSVLSDSDCLSAAYTGGPVGNFTLPYTGNTMWSSPSSGVVKLASPIAIPIKATGIPASPIPGFLRVFRATVPSMDIEVSATRESQKALLSSMSAVVANQVIALMDLRMRIAVSGPLSFNNAFANNILKGLTQYPGIVGNINTGNFGLCGGLPWCLADNGSPVGVAIVATAYDGPIPDSGNSEATGTKLWEKSYSSTSGVQIWSVSGNTMDLAYTFTANALATGTPTYVRIVKNEYTTGGARYPRLVIQAPIGIGSGYAQLSMTNLVAGSPASLNAFTVSFDLQVA